MYYDLMTILQEFRIKQTLLRERLFEVSPFDFYQDIFPDSDIEGRGAYDEHRPNPIFAYSVLGDELSDSGKPKTYMRNEIMFRDRAVLEKVQNNPFAICSMCTYSGRRRTAKNAYKCYGFAIDLDDVGPKQLETLLFAFDNERLPIPTYIVNSGHGLHLYYVFQNPVPLYPNVVNRLQLLKHGLTWTVWTNETSRIKSTPSNDNRQYQGIYQGFRCPGSQTKLGQGKAKKKYLVTAYSFGNPQRDRTTFEELNKWVLDKYKVPDNPDYSAWEWADEHVTIDEAREKYPEWYQRRIVEKQPAGKYHLNRAVYDWWFRTIQEGENAHDGNRYNCLAGLFCYAVKCDIPLEEVWKDALSLLDWMNGLTIENGEPFTIDDIKAAAKFYKPSYSRYSIKALEARTGIKIKRRKPSKYTKTEAVSIARTIQGIRDKNGEWRNKEGRPDKSEIVRQWQKEHPGGRKVDCIKDTGLTKPTVYKWWK